MIVLASDSLRACILPLGATLSGLWIADNPRSVVLGSPDTDAYLRGLLYAGAIVGPVANRISGARVNIDGDVLTLPANDGAHCLHNGPEGLHARTWEITEQTESSVTLSVHLRNGDAGLPGDRRISARYALTEPGTLELEISAMTDRPTLMNPAHHPYWSLSDAGLARHSLEISADHVLETDAHTLPTGRVLSVAGTDYDFRSARTIPDDRILDANCCLRRQSATQPEPAARLTEPGGISLDIATTSPGLQLYNGAGLADPSVRMHPQQTLAPFAGVALEPQGWPDAPAHPDFPSIRLDPDVPYFQHTVYRISH